MPKGLGLYDVAHAVAGKEEFLSMHVYSGTGLLPHHMALLHHASDVVRAIVLRAPDCHGAPTSCGGQLRTPYGMISYSEGWISGHLIRPYSGRIVQTTLLK